MTEVFYVIPVFGTGEGQQKNVGNAAGQKSRSKIKGDSYNDKVITFR